VPKPESWRVLSEHDGADGLVLAIDYGVAHRQESSFSDLAARLDPSRTVWETLPPGPVELWLNDVRHGGREVTAVLGYCVGAVFAAEISTEIAQWQAEPPDLLLFDPEAPTPSGLVRDFERAAGQLMPMLSATESARVHRAVDRAMAECDDFARFAASLVDLFTEAATLAFDRAGVPPTFRNDLVTAFADFVSYVRAAHRSEPPKSWASATAVTSSPPSRWSELAGHRISVATESRHLLSDDQVARTVSGLLR
jgi:hypothetical protein